MKFLNALKKVDTVLAGISKRIVAVIMIVLLSILFSGAVARYVFNHSIMWVDELASYLLVLLTMFGCYAALYDGKLAAVTFIVEKLSPKMRTGVKIGAHLACIVLLLALAGYSVKLCLSPMIINTRMPVLRWSKIYFYISLPLLSAIMALHETVSILSIAIGQKPEAAGEEVKR